MMHPNFYHWLEHAELKPDKSTLQERWAAAAKFGGGIQADDLCALIGLVVFPAQESDFTRKFSEALVSEDPAFPTEKNLELLRVMATAAACELMAETTVTADAAALGLHAATFPLRPVQPICKDILPRVSKYLDEESNRMRPVNSAGENLKALDEAVEREDWSQNPEAIALLGTAVVELGEGLTQLSEESQFLWWLLGKRSPSLGLTRDKLTRVRYALPAAAEADERTTTLPPTAGIESVIEAVLSQCRKPRRVKLPLVESMESVDLAWLRQIKLPSDAVELTPITALLRLKNSAAEVTPRLLEQLNLPGDCAVSAEVLAIQFFRELAFLRSLQRMK